MDTHIVALSTSQGFVLYCTENSMIHQLLIVKSSYCFDNPIKCISVIVNNNTFIESKCISEPISTDKATWLLVIIKS